MDWNKVINWDEVPEDMGVFREKRTDTIQIGGKESSYWDDRYEEIKRPIKLEDGAWYAFTYQGVNKAGMFLENDNTIRMGNIRHRIAEVKIHKKLTDEMWK